ncbi:ESX secretion-associated protein EspG [Mycobacterium aquaticum]|uniref:ESX secretion-associated protein EspG n=1 Tax=Mycobacterium aquaticum TaxID=1927124 RepID=A0A1X0B313_9MYCO|nr:ESX secretion-associated protein EspG [Mycobacterium aquaticum]ORA36236.1 ESX secretion-associated protein EspG [Mycobacterium aquaticum]
MSAPATALFELTDDELHTLGIRLGIADFPVVLAMRPRHGTIGALERAYDAAGRSLTSRGLLSTGGVLPELADLVQVLRRPSRELALRLVTPDGLARVCVAQTGSLGVSARRIGNSVTLRTLGSRCGVAELIRAVLVELPAAGPASVDGFGAPTVELTECLHGGHDATYLTDRLRALGAGHQVALVLGAAFASRIAFGEIVCHALDPSADRVTRTPGAVGVFYTRRGRLVSAPSVSPTGQLWTTIKPGSDHRVAQAVSQLAELVPAGWEGDAQ